MKLFDYTGLLKEGNQKLHLYANTIADGSVVSTTPGDEDGKGIHHIKSHTGGAYYHHITKAMEAYRRGKVERLKWLDTITMNHIENNILSTFHSDEDNNNHNNNNTNNNDENEDGETKSSHSTNHHCTHLYVGLPYFEVPVIYEEMQYFSNNSKEHQWLIKQQAESLSLHRHNNILKDDNNNNNNNFNNNNNNNNSDSDAADDDNDRENNNDSKRKIKRTSQNKYITNTNRRIRARTRGNSVMSPEAINEMYWKESLNLIVDPDLHNKAPNPAEVKYRRLARGILQKGYLTDMNLKPNKQERERLQNIFKSHKNSISTLDRDILWKFRHSLIEEKRALTKFLLTIDFTNEHEVNEAKHLLPKWKRIDVADALLLLGQHFENNYIVRRHAIGILDDASDDEIDLFMLQLVQAMRYEPNPIYIADGSISTTTAAAYNDDNGNKKEEETEDNNNTIQGIKKEQQQQQNNNNNNNDDDDETKRKETAMSLEDKLKQESLLSIFLIDRSVESFALASSFYWYLRVEKENQNDTKFTVIYNIFLQTLRKTEYGRARLAELERQSMWLKRIGDAKHDATKNQGFGRSSRDAMLSKLKKSLHPGGKFADMLLFEPPIISPLDTRLMFVKIVPSKTLMFKSKIYPVVYTFNVEPKAMDDTHRKETASFDGKERRIRRQSKFIFILIYLYLYVFTSF